MGASLRQGFRMRLSKQSALLLTDHCGPTYVKPVLRLLASWLQWIQVVTAGVATSYEQLSEQQQLQVVTPGVATQRIWHSFENRPLQLFQFLYASLWSWERCETQLNQ
jgi:hypothetical protein